VEQARTSFARSQARREQARQLAVEEAAHEGMTMQPRARGQQHVFDVVRVVDDRNAGWHRIGVAHQRQHVEMDDVRVARQFRDARAHRPRGVFRGHERLARHRAAQQRPGQRELRAFARDREGLEAGQVLAHLLGGVGIVVQALETQQGHFVACGQPFEHVPGAQLVPLAWRERQPAGDEQHAGHQCFFHSRDASGASEAGSDNSAAALSMTKVPAAGDSGMRAASRGSCSPIAAHR
jgi:hypothetical protein